MVASLFLINQAWHWHNSFASLINCPHVGCLWRNLLCPRFWYSWTAQGTVSEEEGCRGFSKWIQSTHTCNCKRDGRWHFFSYFTGLYLNRPLWPGSWFRDICSSHWFVLMFFWPVVQDLQKVERYIPLLENLVVRVEAVSNNSQVLQWTSDLRIRWTSVLSSSGPFGLGALKYYRVDSLRYELGMILFLYGGLLRERALEILSTGKAIVLTLIFLPCSGSNSYWFDVQTFNFMFRH